MCAVRADVNGERASMQQCSCNRAMFVVGWMGAAQFRFVMISCLALLHFRFRQGEPATDLPVAARVVNVLLALVWVDNAAKDDP